MKRILFGIVALFLITGILFAATYSDSVNFGNGRLYAKNPSGNALSIYVSGTKSRTLTVNTGSGSVSLSNTGSIHVSSGTIEVYFKNSSNKTTWSKTYN